MCWSVEFDQAREDGLLRVMRLLCVMMAARETFHNHSMFLKGKLTRLPERLVTQSDWKENGIRNACRKILISEYGRDE